MDKIMEILKDVRDDIDFENEKALIDDELMDSFDVVGIASELMEEYDIEITVEDIEPENFNSAEAIYELVQQKIAEKE